MKQPAKKIAIKKNTVSASSQGSMLWLGIGAVIISIGLFQAINLHWVSDDAFITFRYVKNFVAGNGIVYNIGEYVEGYTHFLWLLMLSAAKFIGFDPVNASIYLGIFAYASTLCIYILISRKEQKRLVNKFPGKIFLPLAAILLAMNYDMNIWASGGLETSLYTFFISLAFYVWFYTAFAERKKLLFLGSILLLATLTRPDGILFTLTAAGLLAVQGLKTKIPVAQNIKRIGYLVLPSLIIGIPYLLWKYNYYGDIFPTPYYAKSASENYFGQGFFYIFIFFRVYISIALALVGLLLVLNSRNKEISASKPTTGSPLIAVTAAIAVYLILYIARVGGDFMFARFMIPVLPLLYFLVESFVNNLPNKFSKYRLAICIAFIAVTFLERQLRENLLFHYDVASAQQSGNWSDDEGGGATRGIADERWVYTRKRFVVGDGMAGSLDVYCDIGKFYQPFFEGLPVKVAIMGGQNSIAYNADFYNCIDVYGLTDNYIAHLPIRKRGRIGHEKEAPDDYLRMRGTNFEFFAVTLKSPETYSFDVAVFAIPEHNCWQLVKIINYDKPIMDELNKRFKAARIPVSLPIYEEVMPKFLNDILPTLSKEEAEQYYHDLQDLYFKKYPNPQAEHQILDYIASKQNVEPVK